MRPVNEPVILTARYRSTVRQLLIMPIGYREHVRLMDLQTVSSARLFTGRYYWQRFVDPSESGRNERGLARRGRLRDS